MSPIVIDGGTSGGLDEWITPADLPCCDPADPQPDYAKAIDVATVILHSFAGGRIGTQTVTVRPSCLPTCDCRFRWDGSLYRDRPYAGCACSPAEWRLPGPVVSVSMVKVDGAVMTAWQLAGSTLVRTDGRSWPCCQSLSVATTEPGTWEVVYVRGVVPDSAAKAAAAELACELAKGWSGSGECRLPQRVTTITRQGVTVALTDPMDLFDKSQTGLPLVDLWLAAVNPARLRRPASIAYPGAPTTRRTA